MHDINSITENVKKWVSTNFKDFVFREHQLESIVSILNNIVNREYNTTVIQAPTGTGKSLIAIISAGVLADYYSMKSYILASDLYLWNQYAEAINKYRLKQFGYLKGSVGNYRCYVNGMDYTLGKCRLQKVSLSVLKNKEWRHRNGYSCVDNCLYMQHRFRAETADVTLLTYQLWLYQMNLVVHQDNTGFVPREVIFCDECHNIPDIVEKYAQPVIDATGDRDKIYQILEYLFDNNIPVEWNSNCVRPDVIHRYCGSDSNEDIPESSDITILSDIDVIMERYDYFIDCLELSEKHDSNKCEVKYTILKDYVNALNFVARASEAALSVMEDQKSDVESDVLTKKEKKDFLTMFKLLNWMHSYYSSLEEFCHAALCVGSEYIVVEENVTKETGNVSYVFSCVKEDYLCHQYLLRHSPHKVMMSATVGNKAGFMDNIGTKYDEKDPVANFMDIPNIFDFSKSPIYYIPTYKMSYARKKMDFPQIQNIVYKILSSDAYKDKHGMINTGSYENAKALFDAAPPEIKKRICMYISSRDKADTIDKYKSKKDKVIIGPTLVEGVDLPDDLCRFIIIIKIPYPNISSKTVKAKMNIFPLWYESTTSNTVIQNIGRGVRNENDYCTTFILDGCFSNLFENTKEQYPIELRNRIKVING